MPTNTYSAEKVLVLVAGLPVQGLDGDNAVEIAFDSEGVTVKTGIKGETAYSKPAVRSGMFTIRLMATAAENAVFRQYVKTDLPVPIAITDTSTGETHLCADARIKREPNVAYGPTVGTREWVFACAKIEVPA